ncbi:MAG: hypothetical protein RL477_1422 [Pseudomonadota bacterium]|jgi:mono/diheme cytochrome c family protein
MMQLRLFALLAAALLAGASHARAQDAATIEAGEAVYKENCEGCHGERVISPGAAYDLRKLRADERPRFNKAMADGKGQMPSWEGVLTPEQFDQVWAYIRSRAID